MTGWMDVLMVGRDGQRLKKVVDVDALGRKELDKRGVFDILFPALYTPSIDM